MRLTASVLLATSMCLAAVPLEAQSTAYHLSAGASSGVAFTVLEPPNITGVNPSAGSVGQSVTISGADFGATQGPSTVSFNGTVAGVSSWTDTSIVATVPSGATSGPVIVTVEGQPSNAVAFTVTTDSSVVAGPVRYVYDAIGRLVAVVAADGRAAVYTYDAVGNLLSIQRLNAGAVAIVASNTPQAAPGATITLYGVGFGETAASNAVTFNGVAATVVSATPTTLMVIVPAGAASGPLTITTPNGTTTSTFTVSAAVPSPVIAGFTPAIGRAGAVVTLSGTGFDAAAANNRITFNGPRTAAATTATEIELQAAVPPGATSGRLKLATPGGTATSDADFFVPPYDYAASDIDTAARVTFGQPRNVTISTPGHVGLIVFDGAPGRRVSIVTSGSGPSLAYDLFHPSGALLKSGGIFSPGFVDTIAVTAPGTYTLLLDPSGTATGTVPVTVHEVPADATATLSIGGPPVTVNVTTPGQNARVAFTGAAGQRVGIQLSGVTVPSGYWAVQHPSGQPLTLVEYFTDDNDPDENYIDVLLPVDGTYYVALDPDAWDVGAISVAAASIAPDVTGTIVPGGPPVTTTISAPGQNASLTFEGAAGQRIALLFSDFTLGIFTEAWVVGPNGALVIPSGPLYSGSDYRDTVTLPLTGVYTIVIDPRQGDVGSITTTLFDVPPDLTGALPVNGPPQTVVLSPGQNGTLTFEGTPGQIVALQLSGVTIARTRVTVRNPDGTTLGAVTVTTAGGAIVDKTLPAAGTYTVTLDPEKANAGSMTLTLTASGDVLGTIVPGGPPVAVTIANAGQNARLTFEGTAGQKVSVRGTGITVTSTTVSILNPDGTALGTTTTFATSGSSNFMDTKTLPATGSYTLFLDPSFAYTGSLTVTLHDVVDIASPITMDGGAVPVTFTTPGQTARFTFAAPAAQRISVRLTNISGASGTFALLRPDGTTQTSASVGSSASYFLDATTLASAGTYTLSLDPFVANVGSLNLALYNANDVTGSIVAGGPAVPVTIASPGQAARLSFTGTEGQRVSLSATGVTIASSTLAILLPDGAVLTSRSAFTGTTLIDPVLLPVSGAYTVLLDPSSTNTGAATLTLYEASDVTGAIVPGGPAVTLTMTTPGQNARLTFDGAAQQRVSLRATSVTIASSTLAILRPDGTTLSSTSVGTSGGFIDALTLPVTGTYTVLVDPSGSNTGNITLTLYDVVDVAGPIAVAGSAVGVSIVTPGQNARLTFSGAAADVVSVNATNVTIGGSSTVAILRPDGSTLASRTVTTSGGLLDAVSLPVSGTYTVLLDPAGVNTGDATLAAHNPADLTGTIAPGGAPVTLTIATPGQNARLTFAGAALQRVSLRATSVTIASATMAILRPDGTTLSSVTANTSGGYIDTQQLPVAGTYTVLVDPANANTGNITLTLYDVVDITGTTSIGGPAVPVTIATPGQSARLTFEGVAAQTVSVNATGVTIGGSTTVAVLRPDGTTLASRTVTTSGGLLEAVSLPVSGSYTLLLDPASFNTGNASLSVHNPVDLTGTITPGGAAVGLSITTPGQNARLTFTGAASQRISLRATGVTIASATLALLRPDGTTLSSVTANTSGGYIDTQTLPEAGTYTVLVDPAGSNTGNITLTLYNVVDVTGTIAVDGPAVAVTASTPGQSVLLAFDGTAGQSVSLNVTAVTIGGSTTIGILRPDGTTLSSRTVTTSGGLLEPATLPVTGSYTAVVNPAASNTGNATLRLHGVADVTGAIAAGGGAVAVAIAAPGQNARLAFGGTAGQRVSVNAAGVTIGGSTTLAVLAPNGTTLASRTVTTSGGLLEPVTLPGAGTYTVLLDPAAANTGNASLTLYDVPADVTGTLTINGAGVSVTIATPGQKAALTFAGTSGHQVTVRITGNTAGSTTVRLLRPDGSQQTTSTSSASGFNLSQQTLATTGTYTVTIDPAQANTGSLTVSVTNP